MLADPRHSRIVLVNPARSVSVGVTAESAARWQAGIALLPAVVELFGVSVFVIGEYDPEHMPEALQGSVTFLDVDAFSSLWRDHRLVAPLSTSDVGVICLAGTWLEEEVLFAALEAAKLGYDVRLLADLSIARVEADRALALHRLTLHGVLTTTVRQTLLEWTLSVDDAALKERVRRVLL
jgi:nicotinamidase-related amidase